MTTDQSLLYRSRSWKGCPLVNPLCPSDICCLDADHEGEHLLTTELPEEAHEKAPPFFMALPGTSLDRLQRLARERADELWGPEPWA